jgi:error-prone DNA polymerase
VPRSVSVGAGGDERQLALPLGPTTEVPELTEQTSWERMLADYRLTSLSVDLHPLELLRPHLPGEVVGSADFADLPHGSPVTVAGLVVARQRPATASGVVFMLLEDEHGQMNLVVPPPIYDRYRAAVRGEPLLLARGRFERFERNRNVVVSELATLAPLARRVANDAEVRAAMPPAHHFGGR